MKIDDLIEKHINIDALTKEIVDRTSRAKTVEVAGFEGLETVFVISTICKYLSTHLLKEIVLERIERSKNE